MLFLLTLRPPAAHMLAAARADGKQPSPAELYGLIAVRGCEVIEVRSMRAANVQCCTRADRQQLHSGCVGIRFVLKQHNAF